MEHPVNVANRSLVGSFRIGVDVGGTFTDIVVIDRDCSVAAFKSPSRPADPEGGVLAAVDLAAGEIGLTRKELLSRCSLFVHGSTIATNTLLERKGCRTGLIATQGFRDSLEIRRGIRSNPWNHRAPFPDVLVPRKLRRTIVERLDCDGDVLVPLEEESVIAAAQQLRSMDVEAVAICLLHAYRNPEHERRAAELIREVLPNAWITCSSDVAPVVGEYERSSTAVVNAYVAPRVIPYLQALDQTLSREGMSNDLLLVQSNGGAVTVREIARRPVQLLLSGPAAGVGALRYFGSDTGASNLVSIEVGGTSCDVTLVHGATVGMTDQLEVDGYHLAVPSVEIHTIGAGGGTIATVNEAGLLRAGPDGAGARPGPACYGLGGTYPTVTDCQLVLGRLKPGPYAGGAVSLNLELARDALRTHLAGPLGIGIEEAAYGVIRLVEQNIQHAVERVSIERGHDPREFILVAAGGAGALHGIATARALGCQYVFVPRLAGVFCAFGMCNTDLRQDHVMSWIADLESDNDQDLTRMRAALEGLRQRAVDTLESEGFSADQQELQLSFDLRYAGQQWTVPVRCETITVRDIKRDFEKAYQQLYGYLQPTGQIQVVNLRVAAIGKLPPAVIRPADTAVAMPKPSNTREVWISQQHGWTSVPIFEGVRLRPGHAIQGPAVVEELTTTILVDAGSQLLVTSGDNYLIQVGEAHA